FCRPLFIAGRTASPPSGRYLRHPIKPPGAGFGRSAGLFWGQIMTPCDGRQALIGFLQNNWKPDAELPFIVLVSTSSCTSFSNLDVSFSIHFRSWCRRVTPSGRSKTPYT